MKGIGAALYKDIRLMMNVTGILTLLFAVLLLPAFVYGARDLSAESIVRPFPIAFRDGDDTLMSRSLLQQLREIEMFSDIVKLKGETDEEALLDGAACVLTIPKDFFYAMYTGSDCPVEVTLNQNMMLEATLVDAMLSSILDIIEADQAAWRGIYSYVYGEPDEQTLLQMYEDASRDIFADALSRQRIFRTDITASDVVAVTRRRLCAVLLPMLCMLFSLSALQTLPQEHAMGARTRFLVLGGSSAAFLMSKVLAVLFWMVPLSVLLYLLSGISSVPLFFVLAAATFAASFGVMYMIVAWTGEENAARRWCNLYLLLSLFLSGTLITQHVLPGAFSFVRTLCVARFVYPALNAMDARESAASVLLRILPLWIMAFVSFALSLPAAWWHAHKKTRRLTQPARTKEVPGVPGKEDARMPAACRFLITMPRKLAMYAGGRTALIVSCLCLFLTGVAVRNASEHEAAYLRVAVADEDRTVTSGQLLDLLEEKTAEGLSLIRCTQEEAKTLLIDGGAEGILVIGAGYEEALLSGNQTPLDYTGNASAFSAQAVREMIAGQVAVQRAHFRAYTDTEKMTGQSLSEQDKEVLDARIGEALHQMPAVYRIHYANGAPVTDPFLPPRTGFLALCLILMLLTAAAFTARRDARSAERRLLGMRTAFALTFGADFGALFWYGLLLSVCFFLPGGLPAGAEVLSVCAFLVCICAFSLMLTRIAATAGRVDALAPILTLLICLAGGCFLDWSALSATLSGLMMLSPAGSALMLLRGQREAVLVLLAQTGLFMICAVPKRR
ncbi:MAG: ABC transporter permease [Lachnospiraceae bacterium]|nr:ABC transporter permease [Lachnospiraceae bacterium]